MKNKIVTTKLSTYHLLGTSYQHPDIGFFEKQSAALSRILAENPNYKYINHFTSQERRENLVDNMLVVILEEI